MMFSLAVHDFSDERAKTAAFSSESSCAFVMSIEPFCKNIIPEIYLVIWLFWSSWLFSSKGAQFSFVASGLPWFWTKQFSSIT